MDGAALTCGGSFGMITRAVLMKENDISTDQVELLERAGLPVYGMGHMRWYDPDEVKAFIKRNRINREK
jgi:hypothetical protein